MLSFKLQYQYITDLCMKYNIRAEETYRRFSLLIGTARLHISLRSTSQIKQIFAWKRLEAVGRPLN